MRLSLIAFLALALGCRSEPEPKTVPDGAPPIGPGSDSTVLRPPDTPMTSGAEGQRLPDTPRSRPSDTNR